MLQRLSYIIAFAVVFTSIPAAFAAGPLLDPSSAGFAGQTRSENYDSLVDALYSNGKVATTVAGDKLWVPWYRRSDSCSEGDLQSGNNCNSGTAIDSTHNCMVTDEFSQVGILVAMSDDQARMDQFAKTVDAIASTNGNIPAWRVFRNGDALEACKQGINGNCDTASDATARIIIALYDGAKNPAFSSEAQGRYLTKAKSLSAAFLQYEVDQTCRPSTVGDGQICYWLAAGSNAKRGGIASTDYAYTGYYADAIIAMLQAYAATGEQRYKDAAEDFGLNYLEAAKFNGRDFTVPPGRSYKWTVGANGVLSAECTASCNPVQWEDADAPRAFGMCQANYYAKQMNVVLPGMQAYCDSWETRYGRNTNSIPLQYRPDGSAGVSAQSGYFAQGLQALFEPGATHNGDFRQILDNALAHYNPSTKTWDGASCFGVYHASFAVRALGMGIGRDLGSFGQASTSPTTPSDPTCTPSAEVCDQKDNDCDSQVDEGGVCPTAPLAPGIASLSASCIANKAACAPKSDVVSGTCRSMLWGTAKGDIKVLGCEKTGGYIELYRQQWPASTVGSACLGNGCITQSSGFVRFKPAATTTPPTPTTPVCTPTAEVCDQKDNDCDGQADENDVCAPTAPPIACASSVKDVPVSCTGGTITSDTWNGGRTVTCGTTRVAAWDKSGHFEVYKQAGGGDVEICLGGTCIKDGGFARSGSFPICSGTVPPAPTTPVCTPTAEVCDQKDNDCDSQVDENNVCAPPPPACTPSAETCDGRDNDCDGQADEGDVCAPPPAATGVGGLNFVVNPASAKLLDTSDGTCRTVRYSTPYGAIQAKACDKSAGRYEMYLQQGANPASVCVGSACVGPMTGFASFTA